MHGSMRVAKLFPTVLECILLVIAIVCMALSLGYELAGQNINTILNLKLNALVATILALFLEVIRSKD